MNWRPISEAPKDKTKVMLGCGTHICIGWWQQDIGCYYMNLEFGQERFSPTHFMLVTPPSEQQQPDVNQRLLDAAEQARVWIESDESHRGSKTWTGDKLRAAIDAAKQAKGTNENH